MTETLTAAGEVHGDAEMYTKPVLAIYDPIALGMVCPIAWKCSKKTMLSFYNDNISSKHLDIGPGTGYFLDKCTYPTPNPSITIADLNELVLSTTASRIARYHPRSVVRDALAPLDLGDETFESVALQNVLHCLPGTTAQKGQVFDHIRPYVRPGGVVFGCSVLGKDVDLPGYGLWMMQKYNAAGSFHNLQDSRESLEHELATRFSQYTIRTRGAVAFFEGRF